MLQPKVVLVCMFEPDSGPPGEFGLFRDREALKPLDLPGIENAWISGDGALLGLIAGVGTANTAVSVMALGLCEAVDLRDTYWLVAGIAGGNPKRCSLGSPVWADVCVDGDLAFEIDSRNIPSDWPCGILPLGAKEPFGESSMSSELFGHPYQVFQLNPALYKQAYSLTQNLELADSEELQTLRSDYEKIPQASEAPKVDLGGTLSGARFWHGPHHNDWAERWVQHWSGGWAHFYTCAMEDTGLLHALGHLGRMGKANSTRTLILRTISNFTMPVDDTDIVASLTGDSHGGEFPAHAIALENSYRVASAVYKDIIANSEAWVGLKSE